MTSFVLVLRRSWITVAVISALVLLMTTAAVVWFIRTEVVRQTRVSVAHVEAELASSLPKGSSEEDVMTFLESHHYNPNPIHPVSSGDGYLRAQAVPLGTLVIGGHINNSSHDLISTGDITIFIVLDHARKVDRTYVFERFTGP